MHVNDIPLLPQNGTEATLLLAVRDHSPLSRARLSELSGLPLAAISRSASKLLERGVLIEKRNADKSGIRAKRGLCLNPSAAFALGIEYTPQGLSGVVVDASYSEIFRRIETLDFATLDSTAGVAAILKFAKTLLESTKTMPGTPLGIGVATPGVNDPVQGIALRSTILPQWTSVPIAGILSEEFNLPVVLINTMSASIRAVDRLEVSRGQRNVIFIEYGDGVACGLKLDDRYHGGSENHAGELGHFRVSDRSVPCRCGSSGCLEAMAALPAIAREAKAALLHDSTSTLSTLVNFTGKDVMTAAANGDKLAGRVVDEAFRHLARAIAGLANVLAPEEIILDSSLFWAGEQAFKSFEREFELSRLSEGTGVKVVLSKLGAERNALGAVFSVLDTALGTNSFRQRPVNR